MHLFPFEPQFLEHVAHSLVTIRNMPPWITSEHPKYKKWNKWCATQFNLTHHSQCCGQDAFLYLTFLVH
jgi:hypothetical protein